MSDPVISVRNLAKAYRIWRSPAGRLTAPIWRGLGSSLPEAAGGAACLRRSAAQYRDFQALKDVSFDIAPGEAVGIVGRNGSGKSTLLQIIAGTLRPTGGTVRTRGRVAALLELGAGFNPEFTGRENVYLYTSILGLSRAETDAKFDAIAAYADIGPFLEEPIRTYSTGMQMRLAFAVAAHVEADVIIVDEALGVGDAKFQLKCARTIDRLVEEGRTLLVVSHDPGSIKRLCHRALLLEGGELVMEGRPNTIINLYTQLLAGETSPAQIRTRRAAGEFSVGPNDEIVTAGGAAPPPASGEDGHNPSARSAQLAARLQASDRAAELANPLEFNYGGTLGEIRDIALRNEKDEKTEVFTPGQVFTVSFLATARDTIAEPLYAMTVKDARGQDIYVTNTLYRGMKPSALRAGESARVTFRQKMNLMPGTYFISLGWTTFVGEELVVIHRRYDAFRFQVLPVDRCGGIANLYSDIQIDPA